MRTITNFLLVIALLSMANHVHAQSSTAITYQGELLQGGAAANGNFNMLFSLWPSDMGGTQIGSSIPLAGVPVIDGKFTVELDFGASAFDNSDRWLQVRVNQTTLSPRQPITRTPYAIQTRGLYVDDTETFVGMGRDYKVSPSEIFGVHSEVSNFFAGMVVSTGGPDGKPFYGYGADGQLGAYSYFDFETNRWHLYNDGIVLTVKDADSVGGLGIGTTNPAHPLAVRATGDRAINAFNNGDDGFGDALVGESTDSFGYAVWGINDSGGLAGSFSGNVTVTGSLSKGGGSFKIDHPLDPENKYLYHSFVESPDMMNIYNGIVVTNDQGYATVTMPEWFEALNRDFRYQLTVVDEADSDEFVLAKVVERIQTNQFKVRTSVPNTEISWQVTGIRQDAYAQANRIPVEQAKEQHERGFYIHPKAFGFDRTKSMDAARRSLQATSSNDQQESVSDSQNRMSSTTDVNDN